MSLIMLTGANSGLGAALSNALFAAGHTVYHFDVKAGRDVRDPQGTYNGPCPAIDVLINCAGVNGIDMLEDVTDELWDRVMDTNAKGIMKMTQWALPQLKASKGTVVNVVSNAAVMPMTSSACYNASKGAAKILSAQMARELTRRWDITVFAISPNKLSGTEMSKSIDEQVVRTRGWTMEEAQRYQLAGLLSGHETDPKQIADLLTFLLQSKERHSYLTGCDLQLGL